MRKLRRDKGKNTRWRSIRQHVGIFADPRDLAANLLGVPLFSQFGWLVFTRILRFLVNPVPLLVIVGIMSLFWELDTGGWVLVGIASVVLLAIGRFSAPFSYCDAEALAIKRSFFASLWIRH